MMDKMYVVRLGYSNAHTRKERERPNIVLSGGVVGVKGEEGREGFSKKNLIV